MNDSMAMGPLLVGIRGTELDDATRQNLSHPVVGGVVLFTRNFKNRKQLIELVKQIKGLRQPNLLVCIDQEGGRVQRLREGFTALPPLGMLGKMYGESPRRAEDYAYRHARVMAAEMLACGIDLSFAPVLDLDRGSSVIGDRSFSGTPDVVIRLGRSYLAGMHDAGMKTTGKHFPGHGSVTADSHTEDVIDERTLAVLEREDLLPFAQLAPELDALMIAHVVYPQVDALPAGYSRRWLHAYLRQTCGYRGIVLSDDLVMHAARVAGGLAERCRSSITAGCDLVLVCRPADVDSLLAEWDQPTVDATAAIASLYGTARLGHDEMEVAGKSGAGEWSHWQASLAQLNESQFFSGV